MSEAIELSISAGADISVESHSEVNLGLKKGPLSFQILTDTVDLRWHPENEAGSLELGVRYAAFAAEMLLTRWKDGAPDPEQGLFAMYGGVDGRALRYLPQGFYGGAQSFARYYHFYPKETTDRLIPEDRLLLKPELLMGWWRPEASAKLTIGTQLSPEFAIAPHIVFELELSPSFKWFFPELKLYTAFAKNQDELTKTRIGGLTPYAVPLAGAIWAEFYAEDLAALQWAPWVGAGDRFRISGGPGVDAVAFEGRLEVGFWGGTHMEYRGFFIDARGGVAPWLERQEGLAWSGWFRLGWISKKAG